MVVSPIDEIKQRLDIVEVIQDYIQLKKVGANWRALCPFHSEKEPSFYVAPDKQIWHCFGCGLGGNIFDFVMQIEGVEFRDALRILARKAGVVLRPPSQEEKAFQSKKSKLLSLQEEALAYFRAALHKTQGGKKALQYLKERGFTKETIDDFQVGYAPYARQGLTKFLRSQGFEDQEIIEGGLAIRIGRPEGRQGLSWIRDRFRARIMFPIFSVSGQPLGFTGRIFEQGLPKSCRSKDLTLAKYVNSPNSIIFNKSQVIYGLDKAKVAIRRAKEIILVEGQTDVLACFQAGVKNVVATSGSALTPEHLHLLKRYTEKIVFCFDADSAGEQATKKAVALALSQGFEVAAIILPKDKDPADIARENPAKWQKLSSQKVSVAEFYFKQALKTHSPQTLSGKKAITKELGEILVQIQSPLERAYWLEKLSYITQFGQEVLVEEIRQFQKKLESPRAFAEPARSSVSKPQPKTRVQRVEENLFCLLLKYPQIFQKFASGVKPGLIQESSWGPVFRKVLRRQKKARFRIRNLFEYFPKEEPLLKQFLLRAEVFFPEEAAAEEEIKQALEEIQEYQRRKRLQELSQAISEAEQNEDYTELRLLQKEFNRLLKKSKNA